MRRLQYARMVLTAVPTLVPQVIDDTLGLDAAYVKAQAKLR